MKILSNGLICSLMLLSTPAFAEWVKKGTNFSDVKNVRVSDVARFRGEIDSNLSLFTKWAEKNSDELFQGLDIKEVHNLFLTDFPQRDGAKFKYKLGAFVELKESDDLSERFFFVNLVAQGENLEESGSRVKGDVEVYQTSIRALKDTALKVEVALGSRKAIVKDDSLGIKMVFPLGVGAIDENVLNDGVSSITPRFKNGVLDKRYAMYERKMPRYYMGKPFIRLLSQEDPKEGFTGIGFHAQPNGDDFIRAFDSHGCMRMLDADLYTMYWLVTESATGKTPIVVNFNLNDKSEHPFPKREKPYKRVLNTGSESSPDFALDIDDLVQLQYNYKSDAPVSSFKDDVDDDVNVLFDYDMWWRVKEKREGKVAACKERFKFDADQFSVDRKPYQLNVNDYVNNWMTEKERSKAVRQYEKDQKKKDREYSRAVRDMEKNLSKAKKQNDEDYDDCIKNIRKKRSLKDRLYRWWVHGK